MMGFCCCAFEPRYRRPSRRVGRTTTPQPRPRFQLLDRAAGIPQPAAPLRAVRAAHDLIQLQDDDVRDGQLIKRKQRLAKSWAAAPAPSAYNEHLEHEGEGMVSKRLDSPYRSGPSRSWLKSKNPLSEAVRREAEEEW